MIGTCDHGNNWLIGTFTQFSRQVLIKVVKYRYLRFRRPHRKQRMNFVGKASESRVPDWIAYMNIPKSKIVEFGGFIGHQSFKNPKFLLELLL